MKTLDPHLPPVDQAPYRADDGPHVRKARRAIPSLRPPTLMIDLLFGALMLFAFQMGDPNAKPISFHEFQLPTRDEDAAADPTEVLALTPVGEPGGWSYQTAEGTRMNASEVAAKAEAGGLTPVLIVPQSASVQHYLNAEEPLRRQGLSVGLAVAIEGRKP